MNALDCRQQSKEWFHARLGCVTSSRVADAIRFLSRKTKDKQIGEESASREKLRLELLGEIIRKEPSEHYVSKWMEDGKENEPLARTAYELERNVSVELIGFVFHPRIKMAGASPDGLVGSDGMVEFKCPKLSTHLRYIINGVVPKEYLPQMYWQMACSGGERTWNDFVSYVPDPKLPKELRLWIAPRLKYDAEIIGEMERGVEKINAEVQEMLLMVRPNYLEEKLQASIHQVKAKKQQQEDPNMFIQDEDFKYLCPR